MSTLTIIRNAIANGALSLRMTDLLTPAAGHRQPFQPPTYMKEGGGPYAQWQVGVTDSDGRPVFDGGQRLTTTSVLVDSEGSQANRAEAGLSTLVDDGVLDIPLLVINVNKAGPELRSFRGQRRFTNLTLPHREQDPTIRFGLVERAAYAAAFPNEDLTAIPDVEPGLMPFARTAVGASIITTPGNDLTALLRWVPASLVYGFWHSYSTGQTAERPRLARRYSSTIVAHDAQPVVSGSTKGTVFGEQNDVRLGIDPGDELLFRVYSPEEVSKLKKDNTAHPSNIGAGAVPSAIGPHGFTAERIEWISTVAIRGLLQTPLPAGTASESRHAIATALTVLAVLGRRTSDLFLRSGCALIPTGQARIEWVFQDGHIEPWELTDSPEQLAEAFTESKSALSNLGGPIIGSAADTIELRLSPGYRELIDQSNAIPSILKDE